MNTIGRALGCANWIFLMMKKSLSKYPSYAFVGIPDIDVINNWVRDVSVYEPNHEYCKVHGAAGISYRGWWMDVGVSFR